MPGRRPRPVTGRPFRPPPRRNLRASSKICSSPSRRSSATGPRTSSAGGLSSRHWRSLLGEVPSGYFMIPGEPGIGKSALMAKLERSGASSTTSTSPCRTSTRQSTSSPISAQLILRYRLPHTSVPHDARENGVFLNKLLQEASEKLTAGEKLVIAVDALDEVDRTGPDGSGHNSLLPPNLPAGVYIVVTTRPFDQLRLVCARVRPFDVHATSDANVMSEPTPAPTLITRGSRPGWRLTT